MVKPEAKWQVHQIHFKQKHFQKIPLTIVPVEMKQFSSDAILRKFKVQILKIDFKKSERTELETPEKIQKTIKLQIKQRVDGETQQPHRGDGICNSIQKQNIVQNHYYVFRSATIRKMPVSAQTPKWKHSNIKRSTNGVHSTSLSNVIETNRDIHVTHTSAYTEM